ncbi:MAG TPA: S8 family serine peptidase, partial [Lentzea sp.]
VHAEAHTWPAHAVQLSSTLFRYLDTRGLNADALVIHSLGRQAAVRVGDSAGEARAVLNLGLVYWHQGLHTDAVEHLQLALDHYAGLCADDGQEDIVVDLPYVELAARTIRGLGVAADPDQDRMNSALGLGIVVVQDIKALGKEVNPDSADRIKLFRPNEPPRTNLDKALVWLRQEFLRIAPKSNIRLGKNRTMRRVESTPHIGGGDYPVAAENAVVLPPPPEKPTMSIGLIDTQVYRHDQFGNRLRFLGRGELPHDEPFNHLDLHGTFTVGLILKQAPAAEVVVKAVLSRDSMRATAWDVAVAMTEFLRQNVKVLVLPLVCFTADGEPPLALQRAVTLLHSYGIAAVAAAGNHGNTDSWTGTRRTNTLRGFPAACDDAVAVGASGADGMSKADFNPKRASWIELAGPGIKVDSTSVTGKIKYEEIPGLAKPEDWEPKFLGSATWSGTSFATATVGGEIAARAEAQQKPVFDVVEQLKTESPATHDGIGRYEDLE